MRRVIAIGTLLVSVCSYLALASPAHASSGTVTFSDPDSGVQFFFVPNDVSAIAVIASGGEGGPGASGATAGSGARVHVTSLTVVPGETLAINVGAAGGAGATDGSSGAAGAPDGGLGGSGGFAGGGGGGGGGSSAILRSPYALANRLVVAAGGGGSGAFSGFGTGGAGGLTGTDGGDAAAQGGQSGGDGGAGGAGGGGGSTGGTGSAGAAGAGGTATFDGGGGGGGGLVGGGGGGGNSDGSFAGGGGGGGGSSTGPPGVTTVEDGVHVGDGEVTIIFGDTQAPVVTLETPEHGSSTNNPTPRLSGHAGTAVGDSQVTVSIWPGPVAGNGPLQSHLVTPGADGSYAVDASSLPDGLYTARAHQTDASGNFGNSSNNNFTVDTVAPTPTLTDPSNGGLTNDATPSISGSAGTEDGDNFGQVTIEIYEGNTVAGSPDATFTADPNDVTGAYSAIPPLALPDGTYTARTLQGDEAGNSGVSNANTFTVDTTPSDTRIDSHPRARTTKRKATFTYSAIPSATGTTFMCSLDGATASTCASSGITYTQLARRRHTFSVFSVDPAGNADPTPAIFRWRVLQP